jgi:hypothetical protein
MARMRLRTLIACGFRNYRGGENSSGGRFCSIRAGCRVKERGMLMIVRPYSLCIALVLATSYGCASFRVGHLEPPAEWPPKSAAAGKKSIELLVSGKLNINGKEQVMPTDVLHKWQKRIAIAYKDSGLFSEVRFGLVESDYKADIAILDRGDFIQAKVLLSGLTLTLIPSKAYGEFVAQTTVKDREDKTVGVFEKTGGMSTWFQLFLIPAMPFNNPSSIFDEVAYDIHRAIISEAHARGAF